MNIPLTDAPFTSKTALCLGAMTIVAEDGEFKEEELAHLRMLVKSDESAFLAAYEFFNNHSVGECIATISNILTAEQQIVAFTMMVDIGYSDNDFADVEQQLLDNYAGAFGISQPKADEIYRVIAMRHNFSVFEQ